jgi:hypothetical protein
MIRVDRPDTMAPADWVTKAADETARAVAAYNAAVAAFDKARRRKAKAARNKARATSEALQFTFKYTAYGDDLLREALNQIYGFKCAYCETFFAGQPVAVEHYRPKGAVVDGKKRLPGYYWLAAAWRNLLPSCTDCNSRRGHRMEDGKKVVRGKGNMFPLAPGSRRAGGPGQEKKEKPLLLNPELDDPTEHIEFAVDRERAGIIRPALRKGTPSPKGLASIEVYALDRPQLTRARADFALRLLSHLRNTRNSFADHKANPTDARLEKRYRVNLADLRKFVEPEQPYCAMARQIVKAEMRGVKL